MTFAKRSGSCATSSTADVAAVHGRISICNELQSTSENKSYCRRATVKVATRGSAKLHLYERFLGKFLPRLTLSKNVKTLRGKLFSKYSATEMRIGRCYVRNTAIILECCNNV